MSNTIKPREDGPVAVSEQSRVVLRPLERGAVKFETSGFFGAWQELNSSVTLAHCISEVEKSGALDNFRRLLGESDAPFRGPLFADSDVYKLLEAIAWDVDRTGITAHAEFADDAIRLILRVQDVDGYLNTWVQAGLSDQERLTSMRWSHELYCLGHLIQAAIAWVRCTGRDELLRVAIKFVDLVIGELGDGRRTDIDGHPQIEAALVELWRTTGDSRYLELARRFIDERGYRTIGEDRMGYAYYQDEIPLRDAYEATGHAVRQLYLAIGATDLLVEEADEPLAGALDRIWRDAHGRKMYITGGLGARHRDESFGDAYELPSDRAYSETCASVADFMWNWRLLLLTGESKFADAMERQIYNVIPSSVSISGREFFYANPLQLREGHRSEENAPAARTPWYTCACCPPNVARLVASLANYVATSNSTGTQVHLYGSADVLLAGETPSIARMRTSFPWDGSVRIDVDQAPSRDLRLRVPEWCHHYSLKLDGATATPSVENGYVVLAAGSFATSIDLDFEMNPVIEYPHPHVDATRGSVAIRRGPVIYCLEDFGLPAEISVQDISISASPVIEVTSADNTLGVPSLKVHGAIARVLTTTPLYSEVELESEQHHLEAIEFVPYFRWGNRRPQAMKVWIPRW